MKTSQSFSMGYKNIKSLLPFLLTTLLIFFISYDALALTKPTINSPASNEEIHTTSYTFSWSHPYNDQYELKIKTKGGTLKYRSGKISSKSKTVDLSSILTVGSTYKCYVVVYANGQEDSSEDRWFTYKPSGYCSVSGGVSISSNPVILGQNFTISFTLKEVRGAPKTFEDVAVAIIGPDGAGFDFKTYGSVTVSANGTWSQSATNYIYATRPAGTYRAVIRGKVGGAWFDFDTTGSGNNPVQFTAVAPKPPEGYCSVSGGVSISSNPVILGQNFTISFTLKEVRGAPKTFEDVAVAIIGPDGAGFDFKTYGSVTVSANGTWSQSATNYIYATRPAGTYRAVIRGKVGGAWFDFDTTGSGNNPVQFTAVAPKPPEGYCSVSGGVSISSNPVILGQNFTISFTLKEVRGAPKTFEDVAVAIIGPDGAGFDFKTYGSVTVSANGTWSQSATNYIYTTRPAGTYRAVIRGKIGGVWFDFDTTGSGRNPVQFTANKPSGYCSISGGLSISTEPVVLGQNFTISFTLKEVRGAPKTFDNIAIAILDSKNNYVFDFAMYGSVTVPANGTWSQSGKNCIYATRPAGTYTAVVRGKVEGVWFDFDTIDSGKNSVQFTAVASTNSSGHCSIKEGVSVSPDPAALGQNINISFTLKEVLGFPKIFEDVAVAIIGPDGAGFDFKTYGSVTVPANGTWSQSATNYIYTTRPEGTYRAVVRGKVGGVWFDFDTTGAGVNRKQFKVFSTTPPPPPPPNQRVQLYGFRDSTRKFSFGRQIIQQDNDYLIATVRLANGTGCWYLATPNFDQKISGSPISKADVFVINPNSVTIIDNGLRFDRGKYYQLDIDRVNLTCFSLVAIDLVLRGIFSDRLEDVITSDQDKIKLLIDIIKTSNLFSHLDTGTAYLTNGNDLDAFKEYVLFLKDICDHVGRDKMVKIFTDVCGKGGEIIWDNSISVIIESLSLFDKYYLFREITKNYIEDPEPIDGYVRYECR